MAGNFFGLGKITGHAAQIFPKWMPAVQRIQPSTDAKMGALGVRPGLPLGKRFFYSSPLPRVPRLAAFR